MKNTRRQSLYSHRGAAIGQEVFARPNLFIIGSMKSGITLLKNILALHPDINMCSVNNPSFFVNNDQLPTLHHQLLKQGYCEKEDACLRLVNTQKDYAYIGEASAYYTHMPLVSGVADRIRSFNPDARLLYIIRDPVERTVSHYWHRVVYDGESRSIGQAIMDSSRYRNVSHYIMQLAPFYTRFDKKQIGVYTLEELANNYEETAASIFRWLEVKPIKVAPTGWGNKTPEVIKQRLSSWNSVVRILRRNKFNRALMEAVPSSLTARVHGVFTRSVDRRQVDVEAVARWLRPVQREQTRELSALLGRDFEEWKTLN